jgi:mRNA interferase RelE/StbE
MNIEFDKSFEKSLEKTRNKSLLRKIEMISIDFEKAETLADLSNIKKLSGYKFYYRVKIGDYRLGFEKISENTLRFIIVENRKDIYKSFP